MMKLKSGFLRAHLCKPTRIRDMRTNRTTLHAHSEFSRRQPTPNRERDETAAHVIWYARPHADTTHLRKFSLASSMSPICRNESTNTTGTAEHISEAAAGHEERRLALNGLTSPQTKHGCRPLEHAWHSHGWSAHANTTHESKRKSFSVGQDESQSQPRYRQGALCPGRRIPSGNCARTRPGTTYHARAQPRGKT